MYNLLIIKIICAISPYAWYSCHAHMYLLAYITIRVDIASIPNFINYKKHHLARNETLIWNFIGSLWFLLIVVHRYVVNSGLMTVMKEEPLHIQSIFLYLCVKPISAYEIMKLLFEIISITFYGICPSFFQHCFLRIGTGTKFWSEFRDVFRDILFVDPFGKCGVHDVVVHCLCW